jgi:DNA adenine methylase
VVDRFLTPEFARYHEPFLGGGAVYFYLAPQSACLSDVNAELINAYVQLKDNVEEIIAGLRQLRVNKSTYSRLRQRLPTDAVDRAIRFIYLNRTAFNGLYRVNRQGQFNVPFAGIQGRTLLDEGLLREAAALQHCEVRCRDFSKALASAVEGDLAYCDPPFTVRHNNNGFLRYNESLFSWAQQKQLALLARAAVRRGVFVVVSNADHDCIRQLYRGFKVKTLSRVSCMAGDSARRGLTSECLFIGDPERF